MYRPGYRRRRQGPPPINANERRVVDLVYEYGSVAAAVRAMGWRSSGYFRDACDRKPDLAKAVARARKGLPPWDGATEPAAQEPDPEAVGGPRSAGSMQASPAMARYGQVRATELAGPPPTPEDAALAGWAERRREQLIGLRKSEWLRLPQLAGGVPAARIAAAAIGLDWNNIEP